MKNDGTPHVNYLVLPIDGMTCASCVARVKQSIEKISWIESVDVNLASEQAAIGFDSPVLDEKELKRNIEEAGYKIRTRVSEIVIPGFNDPTQIKVLQTALENIRGLEESQFNTANETLSIEYIPGLISVRNVEQTVRKVTGIKIVWRESTSEIDEEHEKKSLERIKKQFRDSLISISAAVIIFILTMPHFFSFIASIPTGIRQGLAFLLTSWVVFIAGRSILTGFFKKLKPGKSDMNTLISVGAVTAWIYSCVIMLGTFFAPEEFRQYPLFFDSAAFIVGFILLGRSLEARARKKTGLALNSLAKLQPEKARCIRDNSEEMIDIAKLQNDDECIVKNGERFPADGILLSEQAEIDEAMLSGESIPVVKSKGQLVLTGTINAGSDARFRVLRTGSDTALGQIVQWVRKAQNSQPPIQKLVDKIAAVFVPSVIGAALLTLLVWLFSGAAISLSLQHFINVIVIACPCALGLATPTAIIVSMGRSASAGVLVKDASVLEKLLTVKTILFDKTGTLTSGKLSFKTAIIFKDDEDSLLKTAASLEQHSTHPIAKAILAEVQKRNLNFENLEKAEMMTGFGIRATGKNGSIGAGNKKLMQAMKVEFPENMDQQVDELTQQGMSLIFVCRDKELLGIIGLADSIRDEAAAVVNRLKEMHIRPAMITGDSAKTAHFIAGQLGIADVYAEQPPQLKASVVKKIQQEGNSVAMIGDGINDAVALSQADIGVALAEGTDVAIDAADLVLLHPDLNLLIKIKTLAARTERIIKQNLAWAFGYNLLMLPSAAGLLYVLFGISFNPAFAALAMAMSSVSVVTNSLRLKRSKLD